MTSLRTKKTDTQSILYHAINNRMNAIVIGMSVLEHHDNADVRDIANVLQQDLDELQILLKKVRH